MRRVESAASRCRAVAGGDVPVTSRVRTGAAGIAAMATRAGVAKTSEDDVPFASFADGESKQVIVVQQSLRSVAIAVAASDPCEQHGIRVQKPMIALAGARPARIKTTANASTRRIAMEQASSIQAIRRRREPKCFMTPRPWTIIEPTMA